MSRLRTISLALIGLTILISAWFYPQLPAQVPSHWDINGTIDGWQTPLESALFVPIVCVVLMTILWLASMPCCRRSWLSMPGARNNHHGQNGVADP
jgi:uncharacterized membrane protein